MAKEFVFASSNRGKLAEIAEIASEFGYTVIDPRSLRSVCGDAPEVDESADTYRGNAHLKAIAYFKWAQRPVLADDTGLEVQALKGGPGLYTARYAGEKAAPKDNRRKLLIEMAQCDQRAARFVCSLAFINSAGELIEAHGVLDGEIAREEYGGGGFGYDSLFYLPRIGMTLAQAKESGVEVATHRILALRSLFHAIDAGKVSIS